MKTCKASLSIPSVNHQPLNVSQEIQTVLKGLKGYLKTACYTDKEAKDFITNIDRDPTEWGLSDCKAWGSANFRGKRLGDLRDRAVATCYEYTMLRRKLYSKGFSI